MRGTLLTKTNAAQQAYSWAKHAKPQHSSSYSFRDLSVHTDKRTEGRMDRRVRLDQLG